MSRWHQLAEAARDSNLPASDKAVFLFLLSRADYRTAELPARFTPTRQVIRRKTSLSYSQVGYSTRHLVRHGWLTAKGATGPGKPLEYRFAAGRQCDCTGRVHARKRCQPAGATVPTDDPRTLPTNGANAAGQTAHRTERRTEERVGRLTAADVLRLSPAAQCELCSAPRDDSAGFIRHLDDCPHKLSMALYARELR